MEQSAFSRLLRAKWDQRRVAQSPPLSPSQRREREQREADRAEAEAAREREAQT